MQILLILENLEIHFVNFVFRRFWSEYLVFPVNPQRERLSWSLTDG